MARVKLGGLAQDVRGTLNGNVFSRNRGGAYVRTKVSPVQPISSFSSLARSIFAALSQAWSTDLNDVERAAWEAFAAVHPFVNVFGDSIVLSGIAFYQSVNRRLLQMASARIDSPPATFDVADLVSVTASAEADGAGNLTLDLQVGRALTVDEVLYVFASQPLLGARAAQKNNFRLVNSPDSGGFASPVDIGPDYLVRFPDVTVGNGSRIALRVQAVNTVTGAASAPVTTEIVATAIPGPLIVVDGTELVSTGGGNGDPYCYCPTPHGFANGQTVHIAGVAGGGTPWQDGDYVVTVISATIFSLPNIVHAATPFAPALGTAQRVA